MDNFDSIPDELVTTDLILGWLKMRTEKRLRIPERLWMDAALKLNILMEDDEEDLEVKRQEIAKMTDAIIEKQEKKNATAADLKVRATDDYRLMRRQENKVARIKQQIMIAKINGNSF